MSRPPVRVTAEAADYLRTLADLHTTPPDSPVHLSRQSRANGAYLRWKEEGRGFVVDPDPLPTEMPEIVPGMGIETAAPGVNYRPKFLVSVVGAFGELYVQTPMRPMLERVIDPISALYDGRTCIWRRAT